MKSRSLHKEVKKNPKYLLIKTAFYCHNKCHTNGAIRRHFGKQMNKETKLRIHNITAKTVLKFGSEAWVLKKRDEQRLEAAQIKFLRHLLGITNLDKKRINVLSKKKKKGNTEHSKGNKTELEKVATTCTEDGHRQTTKTSTTV